MHSCSHCDHEEIRMNFRDSSSEMQGCPHGSCAVHATGDIFMLTLQCVITHGKQYNNSSTSAEDGEWQTTPQYFFLVVSLS